MQECQWKRSRIGDLKEKIRKRRKKKVMQKISNIDQVLKTREKRKEGSKQNKMLQ